MGGSAKTEAGLTWRICLWLLLDETDTVCMCQSVYVYTVWFGNVGFWSLKASLCESLFLYLWVLCLTALKDFLDASL